VVDSRRAGAGGAAQRRPNQILRGQSLGGTLKPEIIQPATYPDNGDGDMLESR
jgi:hypothetical protein